MADSTHITTSTPSDAERAAWAAVASQWHAVQVDLNAPRQPDETVEEAEERVAEASDRETAAARLVFTVPAPHLPALMEKFQVYRHMYVSTGDLPDPIDNYDAVALASIEADVARLVTRAVAR